VTFKRPTKIICFLLITVLFEVTFTSFSKDKNKFKNLKIRNKTVEIKDFLAYGSHGSETLV
jgi:hypothetical protein